MPELPEVEAITKVASESVGSSIAGVEVLRNNGKYFPDRIPIGAHIGRVSRVGKWVVFDTSAGFVLCHNAMTGYWDFEDCPWTFNYVEGPRSPSDRDVRVRIKLSNSRVLRFHDVRLFGQLKIAERLPQQGPELMDTPMRDPRSEIVSSDAFRRILLSRKDPVKSLLMDQRFLAGIGNIYSNEACHASGIDPSWPACSVPGDQAGLLLEALRCLVSLCIPQVRYDWLNVYRRTSCGTCGANVHREVLRGRATFSCPRCQWEP